MSNSKKTSVPTLVTDMQIVRWYVLTLPDVHHGIARGLEQEKRRRIEAGITDFDYYAPTYKVAKRVRGRIRITTEPLLFYYVFIHASIATIMDMKRHLPAYNLLPLVRSNTESYFPYITDETMRTLSWVARSYSMTLPIYNPTDVELTIGDRVRITSGQFEGLTANVVSEGNKHTDIMVRIENLFFVPLLNLLPDQFEIIELAPCRRTYDCLADRKQQKRLFEAVCRKIQGATTTEDTSLADSVIQRYASVERVSTDIMRTNLYAILLPSYYIIGDAERLNSLLDIVTALAGAITAPQSQALLYLILYAVTDNHFFYRNAHALIDPMANEKTVKASKQLLIDTLQALDNAYRHHA